MSLNLLFTVLVSVATWFTPAPQHAQGLLILYGRPSLAQANALYHGYSLENMRENCGGALMSPADLGKIFWISLPDGSWYGPCLSVDVSARHDFYENVYRRHEVAEVTTTIRDLLKFKYGSSQPGEIFIGVCPPKRRTTAVVYKPVPLKFSGEKNPYFEFPKQQQPIECWGQNIK